MSTKPGDYVVVVDAADAMENGQIIRVREVDGYGRLHLFGFDGPWNPERFKVAPTFADLAEKLAFLKSKGLTVGTMTESGKEPYLAYVIESGSELCDLATINKLIDAESERDQLSDRVKVLERERDQWRELRDFKQIELEELQESWDAMDQDRTELMEALRTLAVAADSVSGSDWTCANNFGDAIDNAKELIAKLEGPQEA